MQRNYYITAVGCLFLLCEEQEKWERCDTDGAEVFEKINKGENGESK